MIVIRQTSGTVHPDHIQLGAGWLEAGWSWSRLGHPGPRAVVAEHAPHHPHELLLVVLRDPDGVPALHLHEVQPRGRGAHSVAHAAKEGVLLGLAAAALALWEASVRRRPRLPPRRLIDQRMLRLLPLDKIPHLRKMTLDPIKTILLHQVPPLVPPVLVLVAWGKLKCCFLQFPVSHDVSATKTHFPS